MEKKERVVRAIYELTLRNGNFPTIREVAAEAELSSSSVAHSYIRKLRKAGILKESSKDNARELQFDGTYILQPRLEDILGKINGVN